MSARDGNLSGYRRYDQLHIGTPFTHLGRYPKSGEISTPIFSMSGANFARTKDSDAIFVKYNPDSPGRWYFGNETRAKCQVKLPSPLPVVSAWQKTR